jgi:hypothetical protein
MGMISKLANAPRQGAIDLAKGESETGAKAIALAIVYLADTIKEGKSDN